MHRPCRRGVKSSLRREPDVPGDLLRAIFGNVTEPMSLLFLQHQPRLAYAPCAVPSGDPHRRIFYRDFRKETTPHDIVTVIATRALTRDERWVSVARRKFVAFQGGELAFG